MANPNLSILQAPSLAESISGKTPTAIIGTKTDLSTPGKRFVAGIGQMVNAQMEAVKARLAKLEASFGGSLAGMTNRQNNITGAAGVTVYGGSLYKGGSYVISEPVTLKDNAAAGDKVTFVWATQNQQRVSGTIISRLGINPGGLEPFADRVIVTLTVNGEPVPTVRGVLLANMVNTLNGTMRFAEPELLLPYDSTIGIEFEVIADFGGAGVDLENSFAWVASEFIAGIA